MSSSIRGISRETSSGPLLRAKRAVRRPGQMIDRRHAAFVMQFAHIDAANRGRAGNRRHIGKRTSAQHCMAANVFAQQHVMLGCESTRQFCYTFCICRSASYLIICRQPDFPHAGPSVSDSPKCPISFAKKLPPPPRTWIVKVGSRVLTTARWAVESRPRGGAGRGIAPLNAGRAAKCVWSVPARWRRVWVGWG